MWKVYTFKIINQTKVDFDNVNSFNSSCALAAKLAVDSFSTSKNLRALDNVVILSVKIGDLVHETQKERGMTAGFLGSNGNKFKTELPTQRLAVNDKLNELNSFKYIYVLIV
ncbi:MAG: nitrate- and nitrite sensing domain-containing protein [Aliarcobacter sp.]